MSAMFENAKDALQFIMSGKAIFTVVSKKTGKRYTYKVERSAIDKREKRTDNGFRFVKVMTGSDNETSYGYLGLIRGGVFEHGKKSRIPMTDGSSVGLTWVLDQLHRGVIPADKVEIWHEGRCGKCGKRLTVPASIASGIGPECSKNVFRCV